MEPTDFSPPCGCGRPDKTGRHERDWCHLPFVEVFIRNGVFIARIRRRVCFPRGKLLEAAESLKRKEPRAEPPHILSIELPKGPHDARDQCQQAAYAKARCVQEIPNAALRWWRERRGEACDEYVHGAGCSCGRTLAQFVHARDMCRRRYTEVRRYGHTARLVSVLEDIDPECSAGTFMRLEIKILVTVEQRLEQALRNTLDSRNKYIADLPNHARQFWRNCSRQRHCALLKCVIPCSTIAPLSHYIAQYY
jgi:hypothetical protein